MSKILAFGDTQIGVSTVELADQRDVLDRIVQIAIERDVDVVIHGGDVFEGPVVLPEHLRLFIDATQPLRMNAIPLIVLRGNGRHDMATRDVHALDLLRELPLVYVLDRPDRVYSTDPLMVPGLVVCALPWVHPGRLIAQMNGSIDHDKVNEYTSRLLVEIAQDLYESVERHQHIVLVAHWAISGSKLPAGLGVEEMREPVLPWAELDALGYDAIIGAHIHQGQVLSREGIDKTLGIVVGSPQQLNFGETGEHGCWVIEIPSSRGAEGWETRHGEAPTHVEGVDERSSAASNTNAPGAGSRLAPAPSAEFIPIPSKRFHTFDLVAEDLAHDLINIPLHGKDPEPFNNGDIVRLRYSATEDIAATINSSWLRSYYADLGASRVQIEPTIIKPSRARVEHVSEQLSQDEALLAWCNANEISEHQTSEMRKRLKEWEAA